MDHELLVEPLVEDGKSLLAELEKAGVDVTAAAWLKPSEDASSLLYLGSRTLGAMPLADAYRMVYSALSRIPGASLNLSQIRPVEPSHPVVTEALAILARFSGRLATRYRGPSLGGIAIDEAYIYPRLFGPMSSKEVVQTVADLTNRTGSLPPTVITLRDGTQLRGIPVGMQRATPDGVQIVLQELNAGSSRLVSVNDVASIL